MYFIIGIPSLAEEEPALSREVLGEAAQSTAKLQKAGSRPFSKACPRKLKRRTDPAKGCASNPAPSLSPRENAGQILAFVSFSMPTTSLKSLAQEAQQHNAVLVMRGLYQDSFVKTAMKLQELGIAVDIHPELFEAYHVTSVPTFVWIKNGHPPHRLKGNVTLEFVAKKFKEQRVMGQHGKETS